MSYCEYVFELHTDAPSEELKGILRSLWNGPGRESCILSKAATRLFVLSTQVIEGGDGPSLERVLSYLRTCASDGEVWYIRDIESWRYGAPIGASITITSLLRGSASSDGDGCRHPVAA